MNLDGKTVLLTGGTGTFGSNFLHHVLPTTDVTVRVYSRDELKQSELKQRFGDAQVRYLIGDVRDKDRLRRAAEGCDAIIHAAALKQVGSCEYNPFEAVKTNVEGTQNVVEAALDCGVPRSILISSDKAVEPINVYGHTKALAEKIFLAANSYAGDRDITFAAVRYGNVIGSRGSVVEVFREQARNGGVTITDPDATRFWLTPQRAVELVLDALDSSASWIWVPKIPSMRVGDVVPAGAKTHVVGLSPAEKKHETLITAEEASRVAHGLGKYVILPLAAERVQSGAVAYRSDTNTEWITAAEFEKLAA